MNKSKKNLLFTILSILAYTYHAAIFSSIEPPTKEELEAEIREEHKKLGILSPEPPKNIAHAIDATASAPTINISTYENNGSLDWHVAYTLQFDHKYKYRGETTPHHLPRNVNVGNLKAHLFFLNKKNNIMWFYGGIAYRLTRSPHRWVPWKDFWRHFPWWYDMYYTKLQKSGKSLYASDIATLKYLPGSPEFTGYLSRPLDYQFSYEEAQ